DAVDDDTGREGGGVGEDLLGQFQPARPAVKGRVALCQDGKKPARHEFAGFGDVAAGEHSQVAGLAGPDVEFRQIGVSSVNPEAGVKHRVEIRLGRVGTT